MTIERLMKNGIVRRHRIDQLSRREISRAPVLVIPVAFRNPSTLGSFARRHRCDHEDFRALSIAQLDARNPATSVMEVHVCIIESRDNPLSAEAL
jgi:hypothetical protein